MAVLASIQAAPLDGEEAHSRVKRFTCDALGHWIGDTGCAAHCYTLLKSGGYCNNEQICVCRS